MNIRSAIQGRLLTNPVITLDGSHIWMKTLQDGPFKGVRIPCEAWQDGTLSTWLVRESGVLKRLFGANYHETREYQAIRWAEQQAWAMQPFPLNDNLPELAAVV